MSMTLKAGKEECNIGYGAFRRMKHHVLRGIDRRYYLQYKRVWELINKNEEDKADEIYNCLLVQLETREHYGALHFTRAFDTDWTFSAKEVREIAPVLDKTDFALYEENKYARRDMFSVRDLFLYAKKHRAKVTIS